MEESFSLEEVVLAALPEHVAGAKDEVGSETRASCLAGSTLESHREESFVWFCLNFNCVCIVLYCECSNVVDPREPPRAVGEFVSPEFQLCLHCVRVLYVYVCIGSVLMSSLQSQRGWSECDFCMVLCPCL